MYRKSFGHRIIFGYVSNTLIVFLPLFVISLCNNPLSAHIDRRFFLSLLVLKTYLSLIPFQFDVDLFKFMPHFLYAEKSGSVPIHQFKRQIFTVFLF